MAREDSSITQDIERHFLSQTVRLSDGTEGHVFSRAPNKNNFQQFVYNCHLCGVASLSSERALQTHISGKKHQQKLSQPHIDAHSFRAPLTAKPKIQMNIAPGEPVPPGFEDEVKIPSIIQPFLQSYKDAALIGIEYCVELTFDGKDPSYICLLCDKKGDQKNIVGHWSSYNHRLKYLEKHFPTVVKELIPYRYNPEAKNIMPRLIEGVIVAIEQYHGRLAPSVCENNDFKRKRNIILQEIIAEKHFDEKTGPNFVHAIDRALVEKKSSEEKQHEASPPVVKPPTKKNDFLAQLILKDRNSLDDISSDSDTSLNKSFVESRKSPYRKLDDKSFKNKPKHSPIIFHARVKRSPPFDEIDTVKSEKKKISFPTPKELSLQASEIAQERYKWEKYRCMLEIAVHELEKQFKSYEKNPEKHPLYPEEWKQFWNRRYKELQAEKKDPNKYDFKPEWVTFWTKRMKEIHQDEIDRKKNELRRRLNLPEDAEEQTDELKEKYKIKTTNSQKSQSSGSNNNKSKGSVKDTATVIDISDEEMDLSPKHVSAKSSSYNKRGRRRGAVATKSRTNSRSPSLSSLSDDFSDRQSISKSKSYRRRVRSRSPSHSRSRSIGRHRNHSRDRSLERDHRIHRGSSRSPPPPHIRTTGYPHPSSASAQNEYYILRPHMPPGSVPRLPAHMGYIPRYYATSHPAYRPINPYKYVKYEDEPPKPLKLSPKEKEKSPEPEDDSQLTVVAVLRLLTALEDNLGSLGPKVVDLLSKALALEKIKANSADDMLMSDDHCVFFETVKEKLKGQLIAEVFDANKVKTVKRAIKNIAGIIHQANERSTKKHKEETQDDSKENGKDDSKSSNSTQNKNLLIDLPIDRQIISSKLAAALVMQERTDITTDEMNKLIYVLILMVKLSKERDVNLSAKDLLIELGIIEPPQIEEEEEEEMPEVQEEFQTQNESYVDPNTLEEEPIEAIEEEEDTNAQSGVGDLESLTDSDLQTLLQNFKHLSSEEQHHLITHLKKLEMTNPTRVEKLRKSVNISSLTEAHKSSSSSSSANTANNKNKSESSSNKQKESPPAKKTYNMFSDDEDDDRKLQKMIDSEDDDDDYNFDDVVKAASKNIARKNTDESTQHSMKLGGDTFQTMSRSQRDTSENQHEELSNMSKTSSITSNSTANLGISLADTQNLIANLMGSLQKNKNLTQQNHQKQQQQQQTQQQQQPHAQPIPTTSQQLRSHNNKDDPRNLNSAYFQQQQQQQLMQQQFDSNYPQQQQPPMFEMNSNNMHNMNNMFYGNTGMQQDYNMQNYNNQQPSQPGVGMDNYNSYNMGMSGAGGHPMNNAMGMYGNQMQSLQHDATGYQDFSRHHQYR